MKPLNKFLIAAVCLVFPGLVLAQGKIAVVNLEAAILQTDLAQARLEEFEKNEDFTSDKTEFENLRKELDQLVQDLQRLLFDDRARRLRTPWVRNNSVIDV